MQNIDADAEQETNEKYQSNTKTGKVDEEEQTYPEDEGRGRHLCVILSKGPATRRYWGQYLTKSATKDKYPGQNGAFQSRRYLK